MSRFNGYALQEGRSYEFRITGWEETEYGMRPVSRLQTTDIVVIDSDERKGVLKRLKGGQTVAAEIVGAAKQPEGYYISREGTAQREYLMESALDKI